MSVIDLKKEKELLEKALRKKELFEELYSYFVNDVYRFAYSLLNGKHNAEDITSRVFMEFYKTLHTFEWKNISIKFWLFRTARNFAYEKFREPITAQLDETTHIKDEYEISFVDEIMNKDLINKVTQEIQQMHPLEQELITLRIWEGMQFKEIAQLQDMTENAVKKRFYRVIEKLRNNLASKNIRSLIGLSSLFTALLFAGTSPSYAAPQTLASHSSFSTLTITKQTFITVFKTFFSGKIFAGGILIMSTLGINVYLYTQHQNEPISKDTNVVNHIPVALVTVTEPPFATPSPLIVPITQTPTPTRQQTPLTNNKKTKTTSVQPTSSPSPTLPITTTPQPLNNSITMKEVYLGVWPQPDSSLRVHYTAKLPQTWGYYTKYDSTKGTTFYYVDPKTKNKLMLEQFYRTSTDSRQLPEHYEIIEKGVKYLSYDQEMKDIHLIRFKQENTYIYESVFVNKNQAISQQDERQSSYFVIAQDTKQHAMLQFKVSATVIDNPESIKIIDEIMKNMRLIVD